MAASTTLRSHSYLAPAGSSTNHLHRRGTSGLKGTKVENRFLVVSSHSHYTPCFFAYSTTSLSSWPLFRLSRLRALPISTRNQYSFSCSALRHNTPFTNDLCNTTTNFSARRFLLDMDWDYFFVRGDTNGDWHITRVT